jgi:hypothetical protein
LVIIRHPSASSLSGRKQAVRIPSPLKEMFSNVDARGVLNNNEDLNLHNT